jgi:hypothetical protein
MGEQESWHQLEKGKEEEMLACTAIDAAAHRRRRAGSDALAFRLCQGPGRHRRRCCASRWLNLALPRPGLTGQDPPSIGSAEARRVLAYPEGSARGSHWSKGG